MKGVTNSILMLLSVATAIALEQPNPPVKKNQTCPSNFVRLSHRCYFFSEVKATWQDAFFQCHSMRSNLAIIKNRNQDKLIKKALTRRTLEPVERWLGGRFDWQRKQWKWAASGKPLSYKGFDWSVNQDENRLQWNCIIVDPNFDYRWSSRSCFEEKHFVCQRKVNKSKKKFHNTSSKLNEIPVPTETDRRWDNPKSRQRVQNSLRVDFFPVLDSSETRQNILKKTKSKKKGKYARQSFRFQLSNDTFNPASLPSDEISDQPYRERRNKADKEKEDVQPKFQIYYRTYKEGSVRNDPLHPRPIVEEYNFANVS